MRWISQDASRPAFHSFRPSLSAREDAIKRTPRHSARFATLVLAVLAGTSLGIVVALVLAPPSLALFRARAPWTGPAPVAAEWPAPARAGESAAVVAVAGGRELQVLAPRLPQARRLAAEIVRRRAAGLVALADARAALERRWRSRLVPAPLPPLSPAAACASLLESDARRRRDLVAALPAPYAGEPAAAALVSDPAVRAAEETLAAAAAAADSALVRRSLLALAAAEDARFARGVPSASAGAAERGAAWRRAQAERADSLDALATRALADQTPFQRELAVAGADERVVLLAAALPDPYAPLVANLPLPAVAAGPLAAPWAALVGLGGGMGGIVALLAALFGFALRGRSRAAAPSFMPARDPGAASPWLHIVAGPTPDGTVRAALELAAHALARGERVLVIDAGARLRLHERLGREARWGLMECLQGDMPVLGLVQYGGRPGFYVLAHGHAAGTSAWAGLGRCLDDARLHFGRIIVTVDRGTPRAFGDTLSGRALEGWWAAPVEHLPWAGVELSGRMGIAFSGIDLQAVREVSLEALAGRVTALAALLPAPAEPALELPAKPLPPPQLEPLPEPEVLDCDLQVQQRLRFLAWMRRVQSEHRPSPARTAPR